MKILYKKDGGFTKGAIQFINKGEYEIEASIANSLCKTFPGWFEAVASKETEKPKAEIKKTTTRK